MICSRLHGQLKMFVESLKIRIKCLLLKFLHAKNPGCQIGGSDPDFPWVDRGLPDQNKISFAHVGGIGDILFSLYFCRDFARYRKVEKVDFFIVSCRNGLPSAAAEFLRPLLEKQDFIDSVSVVEQPPENSVMLDDYRKLKINFASGDIRSWYYNLTQLHLPREFWKPVIYVEPASGYQDKIFITLTGRYCNVHLDCRHLEKFKNQLVFLGLPSEHADFCNRYFDIPFCQCSNMLEMAEYMAGARGFIGSQSGIYSLAECMKIPRILLAPDFVDYHGVTIPGPHNNLPQGGWNEDVSSTEKMVKAVEEMLAAGE